MKRQSVARALALLLLGVQACATTQTHTAGVGGALLSAALKPYIREELFFGRSKEHGGTVSDAEWRAFLQDVVTPLFPGGLTTIEATGHWWASAGAVSHELTEVVIILYPADDSASIRDQRIDSVRSEYERRYDQESVLRVRSEVRASF